MANSRDKSIGASFHDKTKYRRGQLPSTTGKSSPSFKVYANPLEVVHLPVPELAGGPDLWRVVARRREDVPEGGRLGQLQLGQILWSAAGFTRGGQRTHIAVRGVSGIETYVVARSVQDIFPGVYHYSPRDHALEHLLRGDPSERLSDALLGRADVDACAAALAFTGVPGRLADGAEGRAWRYLYQEAGAASQGALLAAAGLELAADFQAEFYDDELARLLQVDGVAELPLGVVLLGL